MGPKSLETALVALADYIDNHPNPSRIAVSEDLQVILRISTRQQTAGIWEWLGDKFTKDPAARSKAKAIEERYKVFTDGLPGLKYVAANVAKESAKFSGLLSKFKGEELKATCELISFSLKGKASKFSESDLSLLSENDASAFEDLFDVKKGAGIIDAFENLDQDILALEAAGSEGDTDKAIMNFRKTLSEVLSESWKTIKSKSDKEIKTMVEALMHDVEEKEPASGESKIDEKKEGPDEASIDPKKAMKVEISNYLKELKTEAKKVKNEAARNNIDRILKQISDVSTESLKADKDYSAVIDDIELAVIDLYEKTPDKRKMSKQFLSDVAMPALDRLKKSKE